MIRMARARWARIAAGHYPLWTLLVILGTANHYLLDAAGGALACLAGFGVARLINRGPVFPGRDTPPPEMGGAAVPVPAAAAGGAEEEPVGRQTDHAVRYRQA